MPYVNDSNLKKDDDQSTQDTPNPTLAGTGDASGGDFGGPSAKPAPAGPTQSGRFVNLQGYLNANAGQNFGGQVAGKVQSTVDQANQAQSDAGSQFTSRVDQNTVQADPNLVSQATQTPEQVTNDPDKMAAWQKQYNASYGGPQSFADAQDLYKSSYGQVEAAKSAADASKSEGGRFSLLDRYFGRPTYNQGEKTLDNLLVQGDATAKPKFEQAQQGAQQAENNFSGLQSRLTAYANNAAAQTQATREQAHNGIGSAINGMQTGLQDQLKNYQQQQKQGYEQARTDLQNRRITPDEEKALGISGGTRLFGIDPSNYLSVGSSPTLASVAKPEDYSKYAALAQLAGTDNTFLPADQASQAGTYDPSKAYTFDKSRYTQDLGTRNAAYSNTLNGTMVNVPTSGSPVSLPTALDQMKPFYEQSQNYLNSIGPAAAAADRSGARETVARYQELQKQLASLQEQFKYNDLLK